VYGPIHRERSLGRGRDTDGGIGIDEPVIAEGSPSRPTADGRRPTKSSEGRGKLAPERS
jgi:hypothetical protein